jgi:hypothetical protein
VFKLYRVALTGCHCCIQRLSGRVKTATFSVIPVFSVAFMDKYYDSSGGGDYYLRSGSLVSQSAGV